MNYTIEKDEDGEYTASTEGYPGTFFGYGKTEEDAIEDLKAEVEFAAGSGYRRTPGEWSVCVSSNETTVEGGMTSICFDSLSETITAREYFAAKAMQGIIASMSSQNITETIINGSKKEGMDVTGFISKMSFEYADSMMEERQ